jgi:hypothetical protein
MMATGNAVIDIRAVDKKSRTRDGVQLQALELEA